MKLTSEDAFLTLIDKHFPRESQSLKLGRGDDCAVIKAGGDLCISSDLFLEDVHFRHSYFSPEDIGYKALAVNMSDIAGMGARPLGFTLDLMIPGGVDFEYWDAFFGSMASLARQNDLTLAGGDLSRAEKLGIGITIWGTAGPGGKFISRQSGSPDDIIFACGDMGLARVGLLSLEAEGREVRNDFPQGVRAHLRPRPKTMVATLLSAAGVSSLMDVSDGLASDLPRLLGLDTDDLGMGAELLVTDAMMHPEVKSFAEKNEMLPEEVFFVGGEDYALLGTANEEIYREKVASIPGIYTLGRVTNSSEISVNGRSYQQQGFDHFE